LEFGGSLNSVPIGGGATTTLNTGLTSAGAHGLALDPTTLYLTGDAAVHAVDIAGGATPPVTLFAGDAAAPPFGVAVDGTSIYWTNFLAGSGPVVTKLALNK
jgi:hypothetical protein